MLGGVNGLVVIVVVGLAVALLAALYVIRRRGDEVEALGTALVQANRAAAAAASAAAMPPPAEPVDELLPVGTLHVDPQRRLDRANGRAHVLLGVAPGRLVGRTVMEAFLDARVEALIDGVPAGGSMTGEARIGDGDARLLLIRAFRTAEPGVMVVLEDVTELRRLEQIRSEFIDNLSHELRTPLSTVLLLAETLARDADGADVPPRMKERIAKVEVETGHLVQMVNELLDLARIEGGTQVSLTDDVDLGRLAETSAERLRLFADRQGVTLVTDIAPDMPTVRGDEERLGQVFINLVHNAVKFSPEGGEVRIVVRRAGHEAVASVVDHGIGISAVDQARIFERFYKADRARVRGGGTGLGLSIARHVVEGHAGRIWVDFGGRPRLHVLVRHPGHGRRARTRDGRPLTRDPTAEEPMDRLLVATLNILNLADRWEERLPLLLAEMAALQPDLMGLQEVVYPMQQDRLLGAAAEGRYEVVRGWAGRPEYGNSLLARAPLVPTDTDRLDLGLNRAAHRITLALPGGSTLVFAVTHLHHPPDAHRERLAQVEALLTWLDAAPAHDALLTVGDFNADPREPAHARMREAGFRSAFAEANGGEPAVTWPSGLQAPAMDTDGEPDCLDYIWMRGVVEVDDARLVFDRPAVGDPTLYASDHVGIAAHLRIGRGSAG